MASSEVFRPSDGDLVLRDNIAQGLTSGPELFKQRPSTQGGYRFGQLSHNSFFTRHNPQPARVRHLKGLLDVPICSVNDDGYFANPRYSLQFPPNSFNNSKLSQWQGRLPVNAINVNSQLHPINTITGLQYFNGLNSYPWRERAVPKIGMVPLTEAWRDELKRFTDQLSAAEEPAKDREEDRVRPCVYSEETGRLIPPPSRAMSRGFSRRSQRMPSTAFGLQHIAPAPDLENVVLTMLCQILQTEDVNAVQAWLCSAGEREKTMVQELIRAAMAGREEYWKQHPPMVMEQPPAEQKSVLPPINGAPRSPTGETNRLVLEESAPYKPEPPKAALQVLEEYKEFAIDPPTNDVFRPPKPTSRPPTRPMSRSPSLAPLAEDGGKAKTPQPPASPEPRLKYTKTPSVMEAAKDSVNTF